MLSPGLETGWVPSTSAARERSVSGAQALPARHPGVLSSLNFEWGGDVQFALQPSLFLRGQGRSASTSPTSLVVVKVKVLSPSLCHPVLGIIPKSPGKLCTPLVSNSVAPVGTADSICGPRVLRQGTSRKWGYASRQYSYAYQCGPFLGTSVSPLQM